MRRHFIIGAAAAITGAFLAACTPPSRHVPEPTTVHLAPSDGGYEIRVNGQLTDLSQIDEAVLARALASHPEMTAEEVRENVRIYLGASAGVPWEAVLEVNDALSGFKKIGIVAEDRRR